MCGLVMPDSEMGCGPERLLMGLGQERERKAKAVPCASPLCDAGRHEGGGQRNPASLQASVCLQSLKVQVPSTSRSCSRESWDVEGAGWSWAARGRMEDLLYWEDGCSFLDAPSWSKPTLT